MKVSFLKSFEESIMIISLGSKDCDRIDKRVSDKDFKKSLEGIIIDTSQLEDLCKSSI